MTTFASYDGTVLAYRQLGEGQPLVCLPGGPGRTVGYFGDLAGPARATQAAALFPAGELVVQPGTAHFPWLDDPARPTATLAPFLTSP